MKCHGKNNSRGRKRSLAYQEHWEHLCRGIFTLTTSRVATPPRRSEDLCLLFVIKACAPYRLSWQATASLAQAESPSLPHGTRYGVSSHPQPARGYPDLCKGQSNVCWKSFWISGFMVIVSVFSFSFSTTKNSAGENRKLFDWKFGKQVIRSAKRKQGYTASEHRGKGKVMVTPNLGLQVGRARPHLQPAPVVGMQDGSLLWGGRYFCLHKRWDASSPRNKVGDCLLIPKWAAFLSSVQVNKE